MICREILKGKRDVAAAKRLLAESGYAGETLESMAAQDLASHKAFGDVTADLLTRLGVKVDYVAVDWGTIVARRAQKAAPHKGGWHIFQIYFYGVDCIDPTCKILRAHGDKAFFGWPNIPPVEAEIASWYDARNFQQEKAAARRINKVALDNVVYAPLGQYLQYQAGTRRSAGSHRDRRHSSGVSPRQPNPDWSAVVPDTDGRMRATGSSWVQPNYLLYVETAD